MQRYDVLVLGAGPSGLAAADALAKAGARVGVIEGSSQCGGLMRGVRRGEFHFDLGRKELYSRFPEVTALWRSLLGQDFRPYAHRCGSLYGDRILEPGALDGLSTLQLTSLAGSYLRSQLAPGSRLAGEWGTFNRMRYGARYYEMFLEGFQRKFAGESSDAWPLQLGTVHVPRFQYLMERLSGRLVDDETPGTWHHPARGTGQIVAALEERARAAGAQFHLESRVRGIYAADARVRTVRVDTRDGALDIGADAVMSSLPLPVLTPLLGPLAASLPPPPKQDVVFHRSVALVYLMATGEAPFVHNWLEVNDMSYRVGRIVNFASWGGDMVPRGKTGLCMEYFCVEGDGLMDQSDDALIAFAQSEAERARLLPKGHVFDAFVVRLPHTNAATVADDWRRDWMRRASACVERVEGLYDINRPGMDRAALAGLDAARAWLNGTPMSARTLEPVPSSVGDGTQAPDSQRLPAPIPAV